MEQLQRVWGQKYRVYLKKRWMTTRAALGKREVERGKLSDKFCLAWAGASMYEASSENHWCCFSFSPINGRRLGSDFKGRNLQRPSIQSMGPDLQALEVQRKKGGLQ